MDGPSAEESTLSALGFNATEEELYRTVLRHSPVTYGALADLVEAEPQSLADRVARFVGAGLVRVAGETIVATDPENALARLIDAEGERLRRAQHELEVVRRALPDLAAEHLVNRTPRGRQVGIEVIEMNEAVEVIRELTAHSTGDLLWFRPDAWRIPEGRKVDSWVQELLRSGRRSRVIYPARVLEEAPDMVRQRAELGEHVRVLADVPGRLGVMGREAALIPTRFDLPNEQMMIIRQPSLVVSLTALFEALWERALVVPGLDSTQGERSTNDRRLLLDQLARGAKDEQIARVLGLSLRTVRRRVADVLDELEAGSRFQAGVEAVRRGWL